MQIFSGFVITGHVRGDLTESGRQGSGLQVTENGVNWLSWQFLEAVLL